MSDNNGPKNDLKDEIRKAKEAARDQSREDRECVKCGFERSDTKDDNGEKTVKEMLESCQPLTYSSPLWLFLIVWKRVSLRRR